MLNSIAFASLDLLCIYIFILWRSSLHPHQEKKYNWILLFGLRIWDHVTNVGKMYLCMKFFWILKGIALKPRSRNIYRMEEQGKNKDGLLRIYLVKPIFHATYRRSADPFKNKSNRSKDQKQKQSGDVPSQWSRKLTTRAISIPSWAFWLRVFRFFKSFLFILGWRFLIN